MSELFQLSAVELRDLVHGREISALDVVEAALDRIGEWNPLLNAVVTLDEEVFGQAREVERRIATGERPALAGVPVGIKDTTPVAGLRTTYGSPLFADHVPEEDALVVKRLRAAGALILGKTNVPEFAAGANTFNSVFGRTRNPWAPSCTAGGSTGGGAAGLASGMIALAEGTDLGGSLRIPASFCGVVGLRPSPGLVPASPTDWPWDTLNASGPMARTAEDVALMLETIAGPSSLLPLSRTKPEPGYVAAVRSPSLLGKRVAYCADAAGIGIDADVERVCREAVSELGQVGTRVEEQSLDMSAGRAAFLSLRGHWMVVHHHSRLERLSELGENLRRNIELGLQVTTRELADAEQVRSELYRRVLELFETFDLLVTPTVAVSPFPVEEDYPRTVGGTEMESYVDWFAPTFVFSLTSLPVASVPCGLDSGGLPVGLQIVGPPRSEAAVLAMAAAIQHIRPIGRPSLPSRSTEEATVEMEQHRPAGSTRDGAPPTR